MSVPPLSVYNTCGEDSCHSSLYDTELTSLGAKLLGRLPNSELFFWFLQLLLDFFLTETPIVDAFVLDVLIFYPFVDFIFFLNRPLLLDHLKYFLLTGLLIFGVWSFFEKSILCGVALFSTLLSVYCPPLVDDTDCGSFIVCALLLKSLLLFAPPAYLRLVCLLYFGFLDATV